MGIPNQWPPEKVLDLRERLGWSQNMLAQYLAINPGTVYRWEKGQTSPESAMRATLDRLEAAYAGPELSPVDEVVSAQVVDRTNAQDGVTRGKGSLD